MNLDQQTKEVLHKLIDGENVDVEFFCDPEWKPTSHNDKSLEEKFWSIINEHQSGVQYRIKPPKPTIDDLLNELSDCAMELGIQFGLPNDPECVEQMTQIVQQWLDKRGE